MTVSTSFSVIDSACNGVTTAFPVAFQFANPNDLIVELIDTVTLVETLLVEGADYTRTGDGMAAPSGIVTSSAYPTGKKIRRRRSTPKTQDLDMVPNVGAPAESQERAWDRAILIAQEISEIAGRALTVPRGENPGSLPSLTTAEGKVLGYTNGKFAFVENDAVAVAGAVELAVTSAATAAAAALTASTKAAEAESDADRAELAADAAALASGIYANEAAGRAAVANGVRFVAVGATSDKAVDIWQRVDSSSSTLLRSYPSLVALNAALVALAAAVAAGATKAELLDARADLTAIAEQAAVSLPAAQASDLTADRMLDTATFIDKVLGVDAVGKGARPYKPVATIGYVYDPVTFSSDMTLLLRAGQQHMITPRSDGSGYNFGNSTHRVNIASYGGEGVYGACPDLRMPLAGQTWTAAGSSWTTTVTLRNSLDFTGSPSVAGVHLMLWLVNNPHEDVLGTLAALKIGNANPAANDAAVDATTGAFAWSIKYSGQSAGDIRGTGHVGDTYVLRVKMADGSNPNGQPLFIPDCRSGLDILGGSNGHVTLIGTSGKDSVSFVPTTGVSLGLIPWFESITMLGCGGHGGVGPKCTVGQFYAKGIPIPGESTFADGVTGGGGCHNFSAGWNLTNQYLHNGSIYTENFIIGCYTHGAGSPGEGYRGWNVPGDIEQVNCTTGFEIEITLTEGFKHAGRLILTGGQQGVNSYPGQYFQLASRGGLFKPKPSQAQLATFSGGGARETIIGSDDPTQIFVLDASDVIKGAPDFHLPTLYGRQGTDSDPAPSLILKHVEDRTPISGTTSKFQIQDVGFYPNLPYVNLTLIGTKLGDLWSSFDFAPHFPSSLYVDGTSQIGFYNRNWAAIEAAYASLGWPCTILPGAQAVNSAGVVIDTK